MVLNIPLNVYNFLGKDVIIPTSLEAEALPADPPYVWQQMVKNVRDFQCNNYLLASLDCDPNVEYLDYEDILGIVSEPDRRTPENVLFRLAYKWCECRRQELLSALLREIDFQRMTDPQRQIALSELTLLKSVHSELKKNSWYQPRKEYPPEIVERLRLFKQINHLKNILSQAPDGFSKLGQLEKDDVQVLVADKRNVNDEYDLYRIVYQWCENRKNGYLSKLVDHIDFARLTHSERKLATVDLAPLREVYRNKVTNALYQSKILSNTDVAVLKGADGEEARWVRYYWEEFGEKCQWKLFNDILSSDVWKLVVFKFVINGQDWVIALNIPERLTLLDTTSIKDSSSKSYVFASAHGNRGDYRLTPLTDDYYIALDGQRVQIYQDNRKRDRTATFVCLQTLADGKLAVSVAFNRFDNNFMDEHQERIRKERFESVEVFLNHPNPMVAPAIYVSWINNAPKQEKYRPVMIDKPDLSPEELAHRRGVIGNRYAAIVNKHKSGESITDDVRSWMGDLADNPEVWT